MEANRASLSALATCLLRAVHARCDRSPLVVDPYGDVLLTAAERALLFERFLLMLAPEAQAEIRAVADPERALERAARATPAYAGVLVRARYTEEQLDAAVAAGVRQYVIVGAGMDTFALRRPELRDRLRIFEIDHPATQELKRGRLVQAGLAVPSNLEFVATDLERESVAGALGRTSYTRDARAFFAVLGVTAYLTREANLATLGALASSAAPGSDVVFDYLETAVFAPERASVELQRLKTERAGSTEPWRSGFEPDRLADELAAVGLRLVEDLGPEEAQARYCTGRADPLQMPPQAHIARARREAPP